MSALKRGRVHSFQTFLGQSILRPFRARRGWGLFPGLKPRDVSYSPFGAKLPQIADCSRGHEQFRNTLSLQSLGSHLKNQEI
jgi:hypothetical protein